MQGRKVLGFGRHGWAAGHSLLFAACLVAFSSRAEAVNWEGKESWFHDTLPFEAFYEGIPGPLVKPMPSCDDRRQKHALNPYEQTAIPGKNCHEKDVLPAPQ